MRLTYRYLPLALLASVSLGPDIHASDSFYTLSDGRVSYFAGVGFANIKAGEYVYSGDRKVSQLDWESKAVKTGTLGGQIELGYHWRLKGRLEIGMDGNGHMVDRDWLSTATSDWTHQSIHPDTRLDHYYAGVLEADRALVDTATTRLAIGGGVGFTDVKWTAYGGSYIYSNSSFRDSVGNFTDGIRGITYQQKIPVAFLSASAEHQVGALRVSGAIRGGASFGYKGIDDHWLRNLRFYDDMDPAPMIGASLGTEYQLLPSASLYLTGDYQKIFETRGDARVVSTVTNAQASFADGGAADYQAISVSFGLKGQF